jgi:Protein of unknown function (DUF4232)
MFRTHQLVLLALTLAAPAAYAAAVPACTANQLSLTLDAENGNFDGMSHSGTLLVLRNIGPDACSVPAFPTLTFRDAAHATLAITGRTPGFLPGMGHGPVMLPAIVASGAELTSSLRWVSGDVYDHGTCLSPATLSVTIGGTELSTTLIGNICGESPTKITYTSTRLNPDPVYKPSPAKPQP